MTLPERQYHAKRLKKIWKTHTNITAQGVVSSLKSLKQNITTRVAKLTQSLAIMCSALRCCDKNIQFLEKKKSIFSFEFKLDILRTCMSPIYI